MSVITKTGKVYYHAVLMGHDDGYWGYCLWLRSGWRLFGLIPFKRVEGRQVFEFPQRSRDPRADGLEAAMEKAKRRLAFAVKRYMLK